MIKGQLDWLGSGWDPSLDPSFAGKDPAHNHTWFAASNTVMLYLNLQKAPFNNLLVRKAISAAINRDQLPQGVAQYAKVANPSGVITPTLTDWIAPQLQSENFAYSTTQAKTYLQQAGLTMGSDGFFQYKGKDFSLTLDVVNGWNDWDQDTAFIQKNLQAAGINAKINTQADYTTYYTAISTGAYDAA
jgi:peptide/nickel transport system substrate-binding protein